MHTSHLQVLPFATSLLHVQYLPYHTIPYLTIHSLISFSMAKVHLAVAYNQLIQFHSLSTFHPSKYHHHPEQLCRQSEQTVYASHFLIALLIKQIPPPLLQKKDLLAPLFFEMIYSYDEDVI